MSNNYEEEEDHSSTDDDHNDDEYGRALPPWAKNRPFGLLKGHPNEVE